MREGDREKGGARERPTSECACVRAREFACVPCMHCTCISTRKRANMKCNNKDEPAVVAEVEQSIVHATHF